MYKGKKILRIMLNSVYIMLMFYFVFSTNLVFAEESGDETVNSEVDSSGIWIAADFIEEHSLSVYYSFTDGIGTYRNNSQTEQEVSAYIALEFNESYNQFGVAGISFDIQALNDGKPLRNTFFDWEETGELTLLDSKGETQRFNVRIKPGNPSVEVNLDDEGIIKLARRLQEDETFIATIHGDKGNWFCEFQIDGYWSPPELSEPVYEIAGIEGTQSQVQGLLGMGSLVPVLKRLAQWAILIGPQVIRWAKEAIKKLPRTKHSPPRVAAPAPPPRMTPPQTIPLPPASPQVTPNDRIIKRIADEMKRQFELSMQKGSQPPNWSDDYLRQLTEREMNREQITNGPLQIPPELLDDYIDYYKDKAGELF